MITTPRNVCLVTGAASGYGEAICQRLFERGSNLILVDINDELGNAFACKLNSHAQKGQFVIFCHADVTSHGDMLKVFDMARSKFGCIDVVVNNAGIWENCEFAKDKDRVWRKVIEVDLIAIIMGTSLAVQYKVPTVVNMSSAAGLVPAESAPIYAAAKHGVVGFTTSLSDVYATTQTRVNCIAPCATDTPMTRGACTQSAATAAMIKNQGNMVPMSLVVDAVVRAIDDMLLVCRVLLVTPHGIRVEKVASIEKKTNSICL